MAERRRMKRLNDRLSMLRSITVPIGRSKGQYLSNNIINVSVSDENLKGQGYDEIPLPESSGQRVLHLTTTETVRTNRGLCDDTNNPNLELICGRPLSLKFNYTTCDLYIADAYFELLTIGRNLREKIERILAYDPSNNQMSVLYRGLAFPNGIALNKDK
ncbi:protein STRICTOSIDINE SYNTHASE-LIKE 10-like [Rutidosis leptorrhynchoides]|uniref:protein STRICTOSIDINE SYNTHASE-LIKE 10-like n=1 Tax=Rutidosis leptorrhynchoides TaxID=125765 RepID=UPI003A9A4C56